MDAKQDNLYPSLPDGIVPLSTEVDLGLLSRPNPVIKTPLLTADQLLAEAEIQSRALGVNINPAFEPDNPLVSETVPQRPPRASDPLHGTPPTARQAYRPQESLEEWQVLDTADANHLRAKIDADDQDIVSVGSSTSHSRSLSSQSDVSLTQEHKEHHGKLHRLKEKLKPHKKDKDNGDHDTDSKGSSGRSPSVLKKIVKKIEQKVHRTSPPDVDDTVSLPADIGGSASGPASEPETISVDQVSIGEENYDVASSNLRPAPMDPATPSQPFLAAPANNNPRFPRGIALVAPAPQTPPVLYSETVAMDQNGRIFPVSSDPQMDKKIKEDARLRDLMDSSWASLSPLLIMGSIAVAVLVVPMPSFMKGFLFGCILMGTAGIRIWFTVLYPKRNPSVPHLRSGGGALIPGDPSKRFVSTDKDRKPEPPSAWMNQMLGEFNFETFHVNQTNSVYVTLDGFNLRIRKTKERVVARRAMFDEELKTKSFTFTESRIYNIQGAEVFFVPEDIPRKRRWLWRFPIGVKLKDPESIRILVEEAREFERKKAEEDAKRGVDKEEVREAVAPAQTTGEKEHDTLYLLPRCNREKEDWFWRLRAACNQHSFPLVRPYISPELSTLNAFVHRICFDVLTEDTWATVISKKIQKKLTVIGLPFFIEELQLAEIDLGQGLPIISDISPKPGVDERGLWAEMNFEYNGTMTMTLSTKLNLMKLKEKAVEDKTGPRKPYHMDHGQSDREANFEVSDEEEEFDENAAMPPKGENSKLMRYVEKIQHSKAFQKLTNVGVVRRAMENVSDTELLMTVVIQRLAGRLAVNLPHPPSDKLWWAFADKPELQLKAFPKLGEKEVTMDRVVDWIENKISQEIHRMLTVPNMDDITIPIMCSTLDDPELRLSKLSDLILK